MIWSSRVSGFPHCLYKKRALESNYFASSPEEFCEYFFRVCLGISHWKMAGIFWWIFSGLCLPRNEARKVLEKFGKNSEQNSGRKFEKFGKLSFCNFSDLKSNLKKWTLSFSSLFSRVPCFSSLRVSKSLLWDFRDCFETVPDTFWMGHTVLPPIRLWGSPKPIHLKPGHLKMAFFSARWRLDGAFFV